MTHCSNCNCYLTGNTAICRHLEETHGLHVRLGSASHLAYCKDCHTYLGKKKQICFSDSQKCLQRHLHNKHNIDLVIGAEHEEE